MSLIFIYLYLAQYKTHTHKSQCILIKGQPDIFSIYLFAFWKWKNLICETVKFVSDFFLTRTVCFDFNSESYLLSKYANENNKFHLDSSTLLKCLEQSQASVSYSSNFAKKIRSVTKKTAHTQHMREKTVWYGLILWSDVIYTEK